jgi:hypothetical protein
MGWVRELGDRRDPPDVIRCDDDQVAQYAISSRRTTISSPRRSLSATDKRDRRALSSSYHALPPIPQ